MLSHLSCELCPASSTAERCQLDFEFPTFDDQPACFLDIARFEYSNVFLTFDIGFRLEGDEDGDVETRIISLETKGATNFRDFCHRLSPERSSSLPPSHGTRTGHLPVPNPSSPFLPASQSFSGDLHSTALTDLKRHILGVCDTPKDNVNVASIAKSTTSLYFVTFVPLSENH